MTATATIANGRPQRRQLGDQLDRLDSILDVLADALPAAVADACKEGAKLALKEAVLELLANPDVRAMLSPAQSPLAVAVVVPARPGWWTRLKQKLGEVRRAVVRRVVVAARTTVAAARLLAAVLPLKRIALVATVIGLAVGAGGLVLTVLRPPAVAAAAVAGGGAAAVAGAVQVGAAVRRAGRFARPAG